MPVVDAATRTLLEFCAAAAFSTTLIILIRTEYHYYYYYYHDTKHDIPMGSLLYYRRRM